MKTKTSACANCGQPATGNFCSHCGTPLVATCPSCGADVQPGSRACQQCGASLVARAAAAWNVQTIVPWAALGLATVALVISLLPRSERGGDGVQPTAVRFSESTPALTAPAQPVDLSRMTPREAADRLFNRVMAASENGNTEEALRFAPMAIQAYNLVGTLDNDARYHVALLHLTAGDTNKARVQIDGIQKSVPGHLLATLLEYEIAGRGGNQNVAARAAKNFLAHYDAEIASGRAEYRDHRGTLERFRQAAQATAAGKQ